MTKPRILFVLHLPPPMHGAALVGSFIRESGLVNSTFDTRYVNLSASSTLEEVGRFSLKKFRPVFRLIREVRRTVSEWKPDRVYLTPSATMPGLLKDALVARAARRKGARVILHFHNKGVAERQDRFVYDRLYRILFRDARVILLSERLYPDVRKYVPEERVSCCANGVSVPDLDFSTPPAAPPEMTILFLSNMIRSKACTGLTSREVHRMFSCSRRSADERFRAATHLSILEAIHEERLSRMQELLLNPSQYLGAIANLCGYASQNAACKFFRIKTGMTMSAWRRRHLG